MKNITYASETVQEYTADIDAAKNKEELIVAIREYGDLALDALATAEKMKPEEFEAFKAGILKERAAQYAGDDFYNSYADILIPEKMLRISMFANRFKVPFGTAYIRLKLERQL